MISLKGIQLFFEKITEGGMWNKRVVGGKFNNSNYRK